MLRTSLLGLVACLATSLPLSARSDVITIESDFQSSLDGWTFSGATSAYLDPNYSQYYGGTVVHLVDSPSGPLTALAPSKFLGDLGAFNGGSFAFAAGVLSAATGPDLPLYAAFGKVTIGGLSLDLIPPGEFHGATIPLSASEWGVTEAVWEANLASVGAISIVLEGWSTLAGGQEHMWLGDVKLTGSRFSVGDLPFASAADVPEPPAWGLLSAGTVILATLIGRSGRGRLRPRPEATGPQA